LPGKTAREAVESYRKPIQQSLSCITTAVLQVYGFGESADGTLTFPEPVSIGKNGLMLRIVQRFRTEPMEDVRGQIKVKTAYYSYAIEDEDGEEIIGYHWHPQSVSGIKYPHLHLGSGAKVGRRELEEAKAHLPTGRIGIEEFVSLLIETFEVDYRRPDWSSVLSKNLRRFMSHASWGRRQS
jgi:hypothetical protein